MSANANVFASRRTEPGRSERSMFAELLDRIDELEEHIASGHTNPDRKLFKRDVMREYGFTWAELRTFPIWQDSEVEGGYQWTTPYTLQIYLRSRAHEVLREGGIVVP